MKRTPFNSGVKLRLFCTRLPQRSTLHQGKKPTPFLKLFAYILLKSQSEEINRQKQSILFTQLRDLYIPASIFFNALVSAVRRCAVRIQEEASITTASRGGVSSSKPDPEARQQDFQAQSRQGLR